MLKIALGAVTSVDVIAGASGLGLTLGCPLVSTLIGLLFSRIEVMAGSIVVCLRLLLANGGTIACIDLTRLVVVMMNRSTMEVLGVLQCAWYIFPTAWQNCLVSVIQNVLNL